jgi:hypothetical protein
MGMLFLDKQKLLLCGTENALLIYMMLIVIRVLDQYKLLKICWASFDGELKFWDIENYEYINNLVMGGDEDKIILSYLLYGRIISSLDNIITVFNY